MTLQEAKEYIAYRMRTTWEDIQKSHTPLGMEAVMDEVTEVYARAKWDEACEALYKEYENHGRAPKPEFKP